MSRARRLLATLTTLVLLRIAGAAPALSDFFPADALLVVQADNSPESRRLWQASPWARTLEDEQVQRFFGPLLQDANFTELRATIRTETGRSLEEILELFNAQIGVAITRFELTADAQQPEIHGVFLLELGGKRTVLEEMLKHGDKQDETTEEFRGVTIHADKEDPARPGESRHPDKPSVFYAVVDDYWIVATPKAAIEQAIVAIQQGGAEEPLSRSRGYATAAQRMGHPPYSLYVNAARLIQLLGEKVAQDMAGEAARNPQANPLGLSAPVILRASGLDTLETLYLGAVVGEESSESRFLLTFTEERGLTKAFAASHGNMALPSWVKAHWPRAAVGNLPIPHVYALVEEIVQGLNPGLLTMMHGQLQMMQQNTGVDLKRDIIDVLGDTVVVGYVPRAGEAESALLQQGDNLIAVSTPNPQQLQASIETFGTMGGKLPKSIFETRDYLDARIYTMPVNPGAPDTRFSFAVQNGYFVFTAVPDAHPLEAVLQSMHTGEGESLWEQPLIKQAMRELEPQAVGYTYHDMPAVLASFCDLLALVQVQADATAAARPAEAAGEAEGDEPAGETGPPAVKAPVKFVDPSQKPTLEQLRRYWSTSLGGTWRDAHSWSTITRISHRPLKP